MKVRNEKKKLTIKPFSSTPSLPPDFEEVAWSRLKCAVEAVIAEKPIDISKEELYRDVEVLCLHKLTLSLYEKLIAIITSYSYQAVESLQNQTSDASIFLDHVSATWLRYSTHLATIRNIFLYLDRNYDYSTSNNTKNGMPAPASLIDIGISIFRSKLLQLVDVNTKIMSCALMLIQNERSGSHINTETLARVIKMLSALYLYSTFEDLLLAESEKYFKLEATSNSVNDISVYLIYVESRFAEVTNATSSYLLNSSRNKLYTVLENMLLRPHLSAMITRGAASVFQKGNAVEIRRLYMMSERVQMLDALKTAWGLYIRQCGEPVIAPADPTQEKTTIVEELLSLQDKCENILRDAFGNKDSFRFAYRSAMEHVINIRSLRLAQLLGITIDKHLRSKDDNVEEKLEQLLRLFRYLQGKDAFEAFYRQLLAKRLLLDNEKFMILALKTECGADYSSKLEGMLKDMELSREVIVTYKQSLSQAVSDIDTDIQVLTTGFWPSFPLLDNLLLPKSILKHKEYFNDYYTERYKGRRLTWQHTLDRVVLTAYFTKGKREFELSLLQAMVLLLFNDTESATYELIHASTGIPMDELKLVLVSLFSGPPPNRVLLKQPKGKELNPSDTFSVDANYTNKLYRVKINTLQLKESAQETEKTHEEIFRDRQHQVDAVIVRLMKARKRLSHNDLMSEVMAQLRFAAMSADIKRRIESLIERDYLERDRDDNTVYNYLA